MIMLMPFLHLPRLLLLLLLLLRLPSHLHLPFPTGLLIQPIHLSVKTAHIATRHTLLLLLSSSQLLSYPLLIRSLSSQLGLFGHVPGEVCHCEDDGEGDDGEDGPEGDAAGVGAAGDLIGGAGIVFGGVWDDHFAVADEDVGGH